MSDEPRRPVVGRVLATEDDTLRVQRPGGALEAVRLAPTEATFAAGDLVHVDAGGTVERVFRHPRGEWPEPKDDALRFLDGMRWARLARRADLIHETRDHFRDAGFLEVDTPRVVASVGTEVHIDPSRVTQRPEAGAQPANRFLIPSPEHHMKRLLAAGAPAIFSMGPVWRDGERGAHHRPEFTLLEWYRPWADLGALFKDCETWLQSLHPGSTLTYQGHTLSWGAPWPRLPFLDLLESRAGVIDPQRLTPDEQLAAFVDGVEPSLGRERPEFVVDYPVAFASLARRQPENPELAERFELYAAGLELANAFGELTDAAEQRARCEADNRMRAEAGREELPLDEPFLAALESGMPPSAGIAVGVDRVIMLLCDAATIDEVLPF